MATHLRRAEVPRSTRKDTTDITLDDSIVTVLVFVWHAIDHRGASTFRPANASTRRGATSQIRTLRLGGLTLTLLLTMIGGSDAFST